jgi:type II secretory pathway pseudopilin PulG
MRHTTRRAGGFTLIEAMVALVVTTIASTGAIAALLSAQHEVREGRLRQSGAALVEAKTQALVLTDKAHLADGFGGLPAAVTYSQATAPDQLAVGASPWVPDPSAAVAGALGTGAYFKLAADGKLVPASDVAAGTTCDQVPAGIFCREVLLTKNLPAAAGNLKFNGQAIGDGDNSASLTTSAQPYTLWTRVSRGGDPASRAVVDRRLVLR